MNCHELTRSELAEALALRGSVFSPIDADHWHEMNCTGVVARSDPDEFSAEGLSDSIVGFVPLQFRALVVRPGTVVPVVYENAVGVHERLRGHGIGGTMIETAAQFIRDRADALFVVRGGEDTPGYRFYRKSGHSDLCYETSWKGAHPAVEPRGSICVSRIDRAAWIAREPSLLALYDSRYGRFGGGRRRGEGYWRSIFSGHVYRDRSWRLYLATAVDGALRGYAVVVNGSWKDIEDYHFY